MMDQQVYITIKLFPDIKRGYFVLAWDVLHHPKVRPPHKKRNELKSTFTLSNIADGGPKYCSNIQEVKKSAR